jgi:hypothetical protein
LWVSFCEPQRATEASLGELRLLALSGETEAPVSNHPLALPSPVEFVLMIHTKHKHALVDVSGTATREQAACCDLCAGNRATCPARCAALLLRLTKVEKSIDSRIEYFESALWSRSR